MNHGEHYMREQDFQQLSQQIDLLIGRLQEVRRERDLLLQERDELKLRNAEARARVEAIILRLRALESHS